MTSVTSIDEQAPSKTCGCGAPMRGISSSATGTTMWLDPAPAGPAGNVRLDRTLDGSQVATVVPAGSGTDLYVSHFATCPNADQYRRPR